MVSNLCLEILESFAKWRFNFHFQVCNFNFALLFLLIWLVRFHAFCGHSFNVYWAQNTSFFISKSHLEPPPQPQLKGDCSWSKPIFCFDDAFWHLPEISRLSKRMHSYDCWRRIWRTFQVEREPNKQKHFLKFSKFLRQAAWNVSLDCKDLKLYAEFYGYSKS